MSDGRKYYREKKHRKGNRSWGAAVQSTQEQPHWGDI